MDPNKNLTGKQSTIIIGSIFGFLVLSAIFSSCNPKPQAVAPTVAPSTDPVVAQPPSPALNPQAKPTPTVAPDFRAALPPQSQPLREFILADPFLAGFLGDVWIGYADRADLISRGFFINPLYKHTGEGEGNATTAKGACSFIGFNGAFICQRGIMAPYQWGIQNDQAIARLNALEEQWGDRTE
jgi:hypothetical protein